MESIDFDEIRRHADESIREAERNIDNIQDPEERARAREMIEQAKCNI